MKSGRKEVSEMDPKDFLSEVLDLIKDLATARHAGESAIVAECADALKARLEQAYPSSDISPESK